MNPLKSMKALSSPSISLLRRSRVANHFDDGHPASQSTVRLQETYGQTSSTHLPLLRKATLSLLRVRESARPVHPSNLRPEGCSCLKRRVGWMMRKKAKVECSPPRPHSTLSPLCHPPNRVGQATLLSSNPHLFEYCYHNQATNYLHHLRSVPSFPLLRKCLLFLHLPSQALPLSPHLPNPSHLLHLEHHL